MVAAYRGSNSATEALWLLVPGSGTLPAKLWLNQRRWSSCRRKHWTLSSLQGLKVGSTTRPLFPPFPLSPLHLLQSFYLFASPPRSFFFHFPFFPSLSLPLLLRPAAKRHPLTQARMWSAIAAPRGPLMHRVCICSRGTRLVVPNHVRFPLNKCGNLCPFAKWHWPLFTIAYACISLLGLILATLPGANVSVAWQFLSAAAEDRKVGMTFSCALP